MTDELNPSQSGEFLIIEHEDLLSIMAFDRIIQLAYANELDPHQAKYLRPTGKVKINDRTFIKGHHTIGFHLPSIGVPNQWRMGSGTQIDILLAPQGSFAAKLIQPVHLTLRMHPTSGMWIVHANAPIRADSAEVEAGKSLRLSDSSTRIIINGLVFNFIFTITNEDAERIYLDHRNQALRAVDNTSIPKAKISGIPFKSDTRFPSVVFRDQFGQGKFGTIFHGVEPQTGDMRAIKRLHLANGHDIELARKEVKALHELQGILGVVKKYDIRNGKGGTEIPNNTPSDLFIVQEKGIPFRDWPEPSVNPQNRAASESTRCILMYHLLVALEAIHRKGWMHRDITRNNLLYFHEKLSRAALCDFGKVHFEITSRDPYIANQAFVPPEVIPKGNKLYTQSLDIFMLGLALAQQWFKEAASTIRETQQQRYKDFLVPRHLYEHAELLNNLSLVQGSIITPMLIKMLSRLSTGRPSATELLDGRILNENIPWPVLQDLRAKR